MKDPLTFILAAYESQEPVLFLRADGMWEGRIQSCCLHGTVGAVARPIGQSCPYSEQQWPLGEIVDMGLRDGAGDEEDGEVEDELFTTARLMVDQAREYGDMSLAERLLKDRVTREEHHGRS